MLKLEYYTDGCMKFKCAPFSCFPEEQETLYFGGETVLRIQGITHRAATQHLSYDKFMEPINVCTRCYTILKI